MPRPRRNDDTGAASASATACTSALGIQRAAADHDQRTLRLAQDRARRRMKAHRKMTRLLFAQRVGMRQRIRVRRNRGRFAIAKVHLASVPLDATTVILQRSRKPLQEAVREHGETQAGSLPRSTWTVRQCGHSPPNGRRMVRIGR